MILFTQWARNMALIASFATCLFNAALRALLNRPVAQLAHRAIFVPIAFTIIDYSFNIPLTSVEMTDTFGSFTRIVTFVTCFLLPKLGSQL